MPSPFPGMDPWLEEPARWQNVHQKLITALADVLNRDMPPHYVAVMQERLVVERPRQEGLPDVGVLQAAPEKAKPGPRSSGAGLVVAPWVNIRAKEREIREPYIEIIKPKEPGRIVTGIEVLSPSNKKPSSDGRAQYTKKQEMMLASGTNLLEIDLLRYGCHTVAASLDELTEYTPWDYLVCLARAGADTRQVWPISVRNPLPNIAVPLVPADGDVVVSLQQILDQIYDVARLYLLIDYSRPAVPPLSAEDAAWAQAILAKAVDQQNSTRNGGP
ncbi:MAG: DUF4058 family protein [Gemmataceae bacterium]